MGERLRNLKWKVYDATGLAAAVALLGGGITALGTAGLIIYAAGGAALGAIGGEVLDNLPYLNRAIPDGLGLAFSFLDYENALRAKSSLYGNLDLLGAGLGFAGGFLRSRTNIKNNIENKIDPSTITPVESSGRSGPGSPGYRGHAPRQR